MYGQDVKNSLPSRSSRSEAGTENRACETSHAVKTQADQENVLIRQRQTSRVSSPFHSTANRLRSFSTGSAVRGTRIANPGSSLGIRPTIEPESVETDWRGG